MHDVVVRADDLPRSCTSSSHESAKIAGPSVSYRSRITCRSSPFAIPKAKRPPVDVPANKSAMASQPARVGAADSRCGQNSVPGHNTTSWNGAQVIGSCTTHVGRAARQTNADRGPLVLDETALRGYSIPRWGCLYTPRCQREEYAGMRHAYCLIYPNNPHALPSFWEFEQPYIDRLVRHAETFKRRVVQRYFRHWKALARSNARIWRRYTSRGGGRALLYQKPIFFAWITVGTAPPQQRCVKAVCHLSLARLLPYTGKAIHLQLPPVRAVAVRYGLTAPVQSAAMDRFLTLPDGGQTASPPASMS
jgi:hypothetical protein